MSGYTTERSATRPCTSSGHAGVSAGILPKAVIAAASSEEHKTLPPNTPIGRDLESTAMSAQRSTAVARNAFDNFENLPCR